jgi:UDP-N-acetylglucosamine 2-epimerase (non-hydrolysing)
MGDLRTLGRPIRLLSIVGTRPEAIKLAPVAIEAARRVTLAHRILVTGQQADWADAALAEFGLTADRRLPPVAIDPDPDITAAHLLEALTHQFAIRRPDMVIVQGDTSSAYAASMAAAALSIPLAHVEAGLRSGDLAQPWPEERNRIAIDARADLLFAPTGDAAARLAAEPEARGQIHVTGNTVIDALFLIRESLPLFVTGAGPRQILLTVHRRENFGAGLERICDAVLRLAGRGDVRILCPVHRHPSIAEPLTARLGGHEAIGLVPSLSYREMVAAMMTSHLILTDSGGLQEEAPALGIPALVLRDVTERQEGVESGNLRLVGTRTARIVAEASALLDAPARHAAMARPAFPFGHGGAAIKIIDRIEQYFSSGPSGEHPLPFAPVWSRDGAPKGA